MSERHETVLPNTDEPMSAFVRRAERYAADYTDLPNTGFEREKRIDFFLRGALWMRSAAERSKDVPGDVAAPPSLAGAAGSETTGVASAQHSPRAEAGTSAGPLSQNDALWLADLAEYSSLLPGQPSDDRALYVEDVQNLRRISALLEASLTQQAQDGVGQWLKLSCPGDEGTGHYFMAYVKSGHRIPVFCYDCVESACGEPADG